VLEDIVFIKDLRQEFIDWAPNKKPVRGKTASKETLEKYVQYLSCLENPVAASGKKCGSGWDGVIEFVTGKRQPKEYYQVTSVAEFDEIFGILQCIFDGVELSEGVIKSNYDSVLSWARKPSARKILQNCASIRMSPLTIFSMENKTNSKGMLSCYPKPSNQNRVLLFIGIPGFSFLCVPNVNFSK
jgi:hypothetical protein